MSSYSLRSAVKSTPGPLEDVLDDGFYRIALEGVVRRHPRKLALPSQQLLAYVVGVIGEKGICEWVKFDKVEEVCLSGSRKQMGITT